jgi:hypothetical protein
MIGGSTDPRVSRIPKIESIPTNHLAHIAQSRLFCYDESLEIFTKVVTNGAKRGNDECIWMLGKFADISNHDYTINERVEYANQILSNDPSPRAKYYRSRMLRIRNDPLHRDLMHESLAAGYAPITQIKVSDISSIVCSAEAGNIEWMHRLQFKTYTVPSEFRARYRGLYTLYTGHGGPIYQDMFSVHEQYVIGRDLDGFNDFWDRTRKIRKTWLIECIEIYLTHSHSARRAALQTVVALRPLLGLDVARMIGKLVYGTRGEFADTRIGKKIKL